MSAINALVGVDFSLIGTKLHAAYEKRENGYSVLLVPSIQNADNAVNLGQVVKDIQQLMSGGSGTADVKELTESLEKSVASIDKNADDPNKKKGLDAVDIKLKMAYLYIKEENEKERIVEYAFQMEIITEGLIPDAVAKIVDVSSVAIAVWNTNCKKVIEKMALETIESYLELPAGK